MTGFTRIVGFDVESTGLDVERDRIVSAAVVDVHGSRQVALTWLINPGIPVPEAATAIHGLDDAALAAGCEPRRALTEIVEALAQTRAPIVIMIAPYDLTLLDRECRRNGVPGLAGIHVVDVHVIDKHVDPYRRGSRRLNALAAHYGAQLGRAHHCVYDAITACGVFQQICAAYPGIGDMSPAALHEAQIGWAAEQADSYRDYLLGGGRTDQAAAVDGRWPLRTMAVR